MYKMIIATSLNHFCISTFGACLLPNFVMLYVYWVENDDLKQGGKRLIGSNFVILCVYWVENDDLKTTA